MPALCTHPNCRRKAQFLHPPKCFFHVEKKNWYTEDEPGVRKWNEEFVKSFWKEIRSDKISQGDFDFSGIIFPEFEVVRAANIKSRDTMPEPSYSIKYDRNFFPAGSDLIFPSKSLFKGAIFEGRSEFVFILFKDVADFSSAVFRDTAKFNASHFKRGVFSKASFHREVDFSQAVFKDGASFNDASFAQRCYLEHITFSI